MINLKLFGREEECRKLQRCMENDEAQLVVVYGRRRIGKTFLINSFFQRRFDFCFTGEYNAPGVNQLENFTMELNRRGRTNCAIPKNWRGAFLLLRQYLESLGEDEKHVVFFDEMPWMDTVGSDFLPSFEYFWNSFGQSCHRLVFVVCGSATSWLTEHIDQNKGGLFNRKTCSLYLQPFTLGETEAYLQSRGICWSRYDIAQCYMILGGIPYYLSFLDGELSVNSNIDALFFRKSAELGSEFDNLFRTLFRNSAHYIRIVETLSQRRYGMNKKELAKLAGLPYNGEFTKKVDQLVDSGFVRALSFFHTKEVSYQLSDYFTMFYFRFARDHYGVDEVYWTHTIDHPARRAWAGLTFEQLCSDHIPQIRQRLGISGILTEQFTWRTRGNDHDPNEHGAQIDLVIDRRDHTISLCEAKFSMNEFEIDGTYDQNLRDKVETFRRETRTKKSLQMVMITTFGVKRNTYSGLIQRQVTLDDLFEKDRGF